MKNVIKISCFFLLLIGFLVVSKAQTTTITFTGRGTNNQYVPLQKIAVANLTRQWEDTLWFPDTILLFGTTNIEDYEKPMPFGLLQSAPNPFDGKTTVSLQMPQSGMLHIDVSDSRGMHVTSFSGHLPEGIHAFQVQLHKPQVYLLTARCQESTATLKLVNNGQAGSDKIVFAGEDRNVKFDVNLKSAKDSSLLPFQIGDLMRYTGYAVNNGEEYTHEVTKYQLEGTDLVVFTFGIYELPEVQTANITNQTSFSAWFGGNVLSEGGGTVTEKGVCWDTVPEPAITGRHVVCGDGLGVFTHFQPALTPSTRYYVRAYAINEAGLSYGEIVSFETLPFNCGSSVVVDHENNSYNTIQIGSQCWTNENLRTITSPRTGSYMVASSSPSLSTNSYCGKQARWYNNDSLSSVQSGWGLLYNWNAMADTFNVTMAETSQGCAAELTVNPVFSAYRQGLCPQGWHVPNDVDWDTLLVYLSSQTAYRCLDSVNYIAKALSAQTGWASSTNTCAVGFTPAENNVSGFSATPSGYFGTGFGAAMEASSFWSLSCNPETPHKARIVRMSFDKAVVERENSPKSEGYSVRCVRDVHYTLIFDANGGDGAMPDQLFDQGFPQSLHQNTFTKEGFLFVEWNTEADGSGVPYSNGSALTLSSDMVLYAQWQYGCVVMSSGANEEISNNGIVGVRDHQNNLYGVVQIGNQCWMKENMRCTTSPSTGSYLIRDLDETYYTVASGKRAFYPNNDSVTAMGPAGVLYNWCAAVDTFNASHGEMSENSTAPNVNFVGHRRGICPEGWHIPSFSEYDEMFVAVNANPANHCSGVSGSIAKALSDTIGWTSAYYGCLPGNNLHTNNSSGFSAYPSLNQGCMFVTANQSGQNTVNVREVNNYSATVSGAVASKSYGMTVRCVRDEAPRHTVYFLANGGAGKMEPQHVLVTESKPLDACLFQRNEYTFTGWNTDPNGNGTSYQEGQMVTLAENLVLYAQWSAGMLDLDTSNKVSCVVVSPNTNETSYGNRIVSVRDHQNNSYGVVQIGNQCWLRENMRCTTSPSTGTYIVECPAVKFSFGGKRAYYLNNDSATNVAGRGLLYNWCAVIDSFGFYGETAYVPFSSDAFSATFVGNRRGICPEGWHVPTSDEWGTLKAYVSSQSECQCDGASYKSAKSLSSDWGWNYHFTGCAIGNVQQLNNITGFSAYPMGRYYCDYNHDRAYFSEAGSSARFWTSTARMEIYMNHDYEAAYQQETYVAHGNSVRCVRD